MQPFPILIECLDCGGQAPFHASTVVCPHCGGQWLQARYAYEELAPLLPGMWKGREFGLWRYAELLPVFEPNFDLAMGEGGTPLIRAVNLGLMLGVPNLFIKDERQGPTNSFKDRQAAVHIAALKEAGITEAVLASTGNVAIAFSAYAARAGIKLWAFLTSLVPAEKMREVAIYGTQVVKVTASYDQAKQLAAEFARQRNLYLERGARSIPSVEGMKTIAFEVVQQLTERLGPPEPRPGCPTAVWRAPDWYFQSVSGGLGPLGVSKGFRELYQMGLTDRVPAIACIQAEGCSPMAEAWRNNQEKATPVPSPRTHIATLATGDPGRTYTLLRGQILEGQASGAPGGVFESVSDEEAFRTMHICAKMEGISMEPASAVAFTGMIKMARSGQLKPDDVIVINCTGHTMPIEPSILGEGWSRNVVIPARPGGDARPGAGVLAAERARETPQEGLLAALSHVTADRFPRVAIVDDTEDARRLIRRILQAQGNYTIYEARDGREALELTQRELPDLIILDLMMPELDGFAVLDALKANPQTAPIPVIVVTAKELTPYEKQRLSGQIHALMQKGEFMNDEFAQEVQALIT